MCGRDSERLYATDRSLQRHMELAHGRTMCSVCLKVCCCKSLPELLVCVRATSWLLQSLAYVTPVAGMWHMAGLPRAPLIWGRSACQ